MYFLYLMPSSTAWVWRAIYSSQCELRCSCCDMFDNCSFPSCAAWSEANCTVRLLSMNWTNSVFWCQSNRTVRLLCCECSLLRARRHNVCAVVSFSLHRSMCSSTVRIQSASILVWVAALSLTWQDQFYTNKLRTHCVRNTPTHWAELNANNRTPRPSAECTVSGRTDIFYPLMMIFINLGWPLT